MLPRRFLQKKGGVWRSVSLLNLAVLLHHLHLAFADPEVGFEDADATLDQITKRLNKHILIDPNHLESALWACNLLKEKGKFVHPRGLTFNQFLKDLLKSSADFDEFYNTVTWKEKKDVQHEKENEDGSPDSVRSEG